MQLEIEQFCKEYAALCRKYNLCLAYDGGIWAWEVVEFDKEKNIELKYIDGQWNN